MSEVFTAVSYRANGFSCDFADCPQEPVGWTRVQPHDRSQGGFRVGEVYMACAAHIEVGTPVFPKRVEPNSARPDTADGFPGEGRGWPGPLRPKSVADDLGFFCATCAKPVPASEVEFDEGDPHRSSDDPSDGHAAGYSHWPEGAPHPHVVEKRAVPRVSGGTHTCPQCLKPLLETGGCTPLSSPECWTTTHRYVKGQGWVAVPTASDDDIEDVIADALVYGDPSDKMVFRWSDNRHVLTAREIHSATQEIRLALDAKGMLASDSATDGAFKLILAAARDLVAVCPAFYEQDILKAAIEAYDSNTDAQRGES